MHCCLTVLCAEHVRLVWFLVSLVIRVLCTPRRAQSDPCPLFSVQSNLRPPFSTHTLHWLCQEAGTSSFFCILFYLYFFPMPFYFFYVLTYLFYMIIYDSYTICTCIIKLCTMFFIFLLICYYINLYI